MKKRLIKGAGLSLCAMLLLAGCSCNKDTVKDTTANISNPAENILSGLKEDVKSLTLKAIYDDLKASNGNSAAANKLLEIVSELVLSDTKWKSRYDAKIKEKMDQLIENKNYQIDGVFSEELLVKTLRSHLYNVTCENNTYGPTYDSEGKVDKYMVCNYEDYINKALKVSALTELLNEKYVYDKVMQDKANILSTKKARLVEYVAISYADSEEEGEVIDHIVEAIKSLTDENSTTTLESISDSWKEKEIADLLEEYKKINTKEDGTGSIIKDFTNNFDRTAEEGYEIKKQEIYDVKSYEKIVITSDKNDILNATLTEKILSENVLSVTANKTYEINGSYYLIATWAGNNVDSSDIRIKDSTNSKYYIVKVDVINNESSEDLVYEAVKVLATNTTLVSDSINYYLEQYKDSIEVYDEEIYTYLKTQYADIFVD